MKIHYVRHLLVSFSCRIRRGETTVSKKKNKKINWTPEIYGRRRSNTWAARNWRKNRKWPMSSRKRNKGQGNRTTNHLQQPQKIQKRKKTSNPCWFSFFASLTKSDGTDDSKHPQEVREAHPLRPVLDGVKYNPRKPLPTDWRRRSSSSVSCCCGGGGKLEGQSFFCCGLSLNV